MAAGLGSSLVLFHSLNLSPHLLTHAGGLPSPRASLPTPPETPSPKMGNHSSKERGPRTNSRPSTSASNTQPAPYYAYQQQPKLDPRDQQSAPYYYQQQQQQQYPPAKPTAKRRLFGKPKAEYQLNIICKYCDDHNSPCKRAADLNGQYTEAYRDPSYRGALKPWNLRVALCWTKTADDAKNTLRKHVGDRNHDADAKGVWCADDLLRELEIKGVKVESNI